ADAARLLYWRQDQQGTPLPLALGHKFNAPGLIFNISISPQSTIGRFIDDMLANPQSAVYQAVIPQILQKFLEEYGRVALPADGWFAPPRPSIFAVHNLRAIVLFHLLDLWYQPSNTTQPPNQPPVFTIDQL